MQKRVCVVALLQRLQHQLGQALGRAHDVGGIHRLVGRDQHEGLHPGLERSLGRVPGADDVVVDALDHVVLDDRHVLVGGGVIHRLHAEGREHFTHAMPVVRIAEQRHDLDRQAARGRRLPPARARCCTAPAPTSRTAPDGWGPDARSAGTAPSRSSRPRRSPARTCPRIHEPNSFGRGGTGSRPSRSPTSTSRSSLICALPEMRSERLGRDCTCTPRGSSCVRISRRRRRDGRRHREQDAIDAALTHKIRQRVRSVHPDAIDAAAVQRLLVVDERHRLEVRAAEQHRTDTRPGITRPVDGHSSSRFAARAGAVQK